MAMRLDEAEITRHQPFRGEYRLLEFSASGVAALAAPGQFVHVRVPGLEASALRRPFSIYRIMDDRIAILYKPVGRGTRSMTDLPPGRKISLIGPLGNGFPMPPEDALPVLVAGGYGVAPLFFLATRLKRPGWLFVGGRTQSDILGDDDFRALGWQVRVTTEDGSVGETGRVTDALDPWIAGQDATTLPVFYACGPDGLLRAVDERVCRKRWSGWISLDKHMGCGVGACLACVQRVHAPGGTSQWKRVCKDGPVFATGEILWDYGVKDDNRMNR